MFTAAREGRSRFDLRSNPSIVTTRTVTGSSFDESNTPIRLFKCEHVRLFRCDNSNASNVHWWSSGYGLASHVRCPGFKSRHALIRAKLESSASLWCGLTEIITPEQGYGRSNESGVAMNKDTHPAKPQNCNYSRSCSHQRSPLLVVFKEPLLKYSIPTGHNTSRKRRMMAQLKVPAAVSWDVSRHNKLGAMNLTSSIFFHRCCQTSRTEETINDYPIKRRRLRLFVQHNHTPAYPATVASTLLEVRNREPRKRARVQSVRSKYLSSASLFLTDNRYQCRGNEAYEQELLCANIEGDQVDSFKSHFEVLRIVTELRRTEAAAECDAWRATRTVLGLGTVEKQSNLAKYGKRESVRREASVVACFRLTTLLYAASKVTRLMALLVGRCSMRVLLIVDVTVVRRPGYCRDAHT
ncbi:hypothetical protein T265_04669 [Opisthorchis viverrini]|uniref:Uncharacterized protein n=1 Tax=Opisthorchis viverrini TaxID=6198 RepID=A0A074ZN34_OPIVI|nr:hypothetical protein T265_04669 [Opisthorchis viverrini]KER28536.1 hypothetical protein T265_04669 [Opisthorchis viverrini]